MRLKVAAMLGIAAAAGHLWSRAGRGVDTRAIELYLEDEVEFGASSGNGNLLGIQPFMVPADYASEAGFHAKLAGYLEVAHRRGWLGDRTVVVFPEYVGTWLVAAGEKRSVYAAPTVAAAMQTLILSNLPTFALALAFSKGKDRLRDAIFRMKASHTAEIYQSVFSRLARTYHVTIVAGSILLPSPRVKAGRLVAGSGPLQNVSAVFGPGGQIHDRLSRKVFPIEVELPFVAPAPVDALPIFDTPAGRLGVLVCADSWYPASYDALSPGKPDLLAVPSYLSPDGAWSRPWQGYDGAPAPADVPTDVVGSISEGEAWLRYALAGRVARAGAAAGINVFLRGRLWDLGADGHTIAVRDETVFQGRHVSGAAIVNLWL